MDELFVVGNRQVARWTPKATSKDILTKEELALRFPEHDVNDIIAEIDEYTSWVIFTKPNRKS